MTPYKVSLFWAWGILLFCSIFCHGCDGRAAASDVRLSAGAATVFDDTRNAFSLPIASLSAAQRSAFFVGNSFFNQNWVSAPASADTRDGLGPLFNARACSGCHFKDGRGRPPEAGQPLRSMLVRISVPGRGPHGAVLPDPIYGDQIQGEALGGLLGEAEVTISYRALAGTYADGQAYALRAPNYRLEKMAYGVHQGLLLSPRVAPALIGLGLLEAVPEHWLEETSDADDRDGDGISGRINRVLDVQRKALSVGRFGWKAEQPSVLQQTAGAFAGDMGITSHLFPEESYSEPQSAGQHLASGGSPEVSDDILNAVTFYARVLAVPARRNVGHPLVKRGEELFESAGCTHCHRPNLETGKVPGLPELSGQNIHPYTDLLLHDMGTGLADHRPSFAADGQEWRTPPLWGIGLVKKVNDHTLFLHDGRARDLTEAVLWHGGEAERAKRAFTSLDAGNRQALIAFVESL